MISKNNNDLNDDFMIFTMGKNTKQIFLICSPISNLLFFLLDPLNILDEDDESQSHTKSDLSTSDYHSFVATTDTSLMVNSSPFQMTNTNNKMSDITDLLGSLSLNDQQEISNWFEKLQPISTSSPSFSFINYLNAQALKHDQDRQWQIEQDHLKYGENKKKKKRFLFY